MLKVKALLTKALNALKADYVVEEGTSGIWTYRKWNSGIAECWGFSNVANNAYASNGAKNVVVSYPFEYATAPNVLASGYINGNIQTEIGFTQSGLTQAQTYLINRATTAITATGGVYWYVIGKLGGVVNKLLRAISNLFRGEVVVC